MRPCKQSGSLIRCAFPGFFPGRRTARTREPFRDTRKAAGFTLIEIMVVVLLIGLMAGAIIPRFGNQAERQRLRLAVLQISDAFALCYSSAVTEGRPYRWFWDEERSLWGYSVEIDPVERPGEFKSFSVAGRRDERLPEGIELEGIYFAIQRADGDDDAPADLAPEVNFYRDGHCDSVYVVIQAARPEGEELDEFGNDQAEAMTVSLNGITGRVKVIDGNYIAQMKASQEEEDYGDGYE